MAGPPSSRPRYRFGEFLVSPARRLLLRSGAEVPLIPRYFDLLVLLLARRGEAVHRREIFDVVWSDVVVSDGALSQAVRTLRRALGDDPRNPSYIRTVSRHGYRFVHAHVIEETDLEPTLPPALASGSPAALPMPPRSPARPLGGGEDPFESALDVILAPGSLTANGEDARRAAAETLHSLGTAEALRRLDRRPGHPRARALLRDARWEVAGAGPVPLLGEPGWLAAVAALVGIRLRRAARLAGSRWATASAGGGVAGVVAGFLGGVALDLLTEADPPLSLPLALALVGGTVGALGAAGVGAGLAIAEALARSMRGAALVICGGLGGAAIGALAHLVARWTIADLFGQDFSAVGGGTEGAILGAAAGLGYALSTPRPGGGGMATPRGRARLRAALVTGVCCALAAVGLTWAGRHLSGASLDIMASAFHGSRVQIGVLGRLFGEGGLGPLTRSLLAAYEGLFFGLGLVSGLTRRPRAQRG